MPTDSKAAHQLKALRKRVPHLSVRALASLLGMPSSTYAYYEDGFKDEFFPLDFVRKLLVAIGGRGDPPISEAEIFALAGLTSPTERPAPQTGAIRPQPAPGVQAPPAYIAADAPRDVPIVGVSIGGAHADFELNKGEICDYARRPPTIANARHVFALYVAGTSMSRWREPGDLIFCDPARPARAGDRVVVECVPERDGDGHPAFLKELVARTATKIRLRQYNPEATIEIPLSRVVAVHRVIEWGELLGA